MVTIRVSHIISNGLRKYLRIVDGHALVLFELPDGLMTRKADVEASPSPSPVSANRKFFTAVEDSVVEVVGGSGSDFKAAFAFEALGGSRFGA